MTLEAIAGITLTQGAERFVPGLLSQNRSRRDGCHPAIAPGHRSLGAEELGNALIPIHEHERGLAPEPRKGPPHGQQARLQNIQPVDFLHIRPAEGPGLGASLDLRHQGPAPGRT